MIEINVTSGFELGSFHYDVLCGQEIEKELDALHAFGRCDNINKRLQITLQATVQQRHNTFLHECLEAINSVNCNNSLKHDEIENIGTGLAQIFKSMGITFIVAKEETV